MAKKADKKKPVNAKKGLAKDLRKIAMLIERVDTPMKILHAQIEANRQIAKANNKA